MGSTAEDFFEEGPRGRGLKVEGERISSVGSRRPSGEGTVDRLTGEHEREIFQGRPRAEGRGSRADGGGPRVEGRGLKAEGRGPRVEGRRPRAEGRRPRAEGRGLKVEGRGPKVEGRGPKGSES
jgi:hypothetical protein